MTASARILVTNLSLSFEKKCLFDDLYFSLTKGDKITIVGDNGCGKTTFLRLLSGADYQYSGSMTVEGTIGYLPQHFEDIANNEPAIIVLLRAINDPEVEDFLQQPLEPFSSEWNQELNSLGGYEIFKQAKLIGLSQNLLAQPFNQLSGGEKTKTMLCALCIKNPDMILLDEPTNHLDAQGIEWLEDFLTEFDGAVVMVTHDRTLINSVSNQISELSPHTRKFVHFKGGYDNYLMQEEKKRQRLIQERQHQDKELKSVKQKSSAVRSGMRDRKIRDPRDPDKLSYNNREHRVQQGVTKAFKQLVRKQELIAENLVDIIPERTRISFDFDYDLSDSLCMNVCNLSKSFTENKPVFKNLSFTLVSGDRLMIQGPNGSGKSTLLKIIMGLLEADQGEVQMSNNAVVGYLDQEQENLPLNKSPVEVLTEDLNIPKQKAISNLCNFGVYTWHDLKNHLKTLSIGCRRKTQLCEIVMKRSSILLLDEPTNHIDFPSLEIIEEALLDFPGIIIAVTHDRYFVEKVGTKVINLSDYKE